MTYCVGELAVTDLGHGHRAVEWRSWVDAALGARDTLDLGDGRGSDGLLAVIALEEEDAGRGLRGHRVVWSR